MCCAKVHRVIGCMELVLPIVKRWLEQRGYHGQMCGQLHPGHSWTICRYFRTKHHPFVSCPQDFFDNIPKGLELDIHCRRLPDRLNAEELKQHLIAELKKEGVVAIITLSKG
jgi:hypothetical protein